jgi:hypothetical protein
LEKRRNFGRVLYVNKIRGLDKEKDERTLVLEFSLVFGDAYHSFFF